MSIIYTPCRCFVFRENTPFFIYAALLQRFTGIHYNILMQIATETFINFVLKHTEHIDSYINKTNHPDGRNTFIISVHKNGCATGMNAVTPAYVYLRNNGTVLMIQWSGYLAQIMKIAQINFFKVPISNKHFLQLKSQFNLESGDKSI